MSNEDASGEKAVVTPNDELPSSWLPAQAPLDMPVQSLREGALVKRARPSQPPAVGRRRAVVIGASAVLTLLAAYQLWWLMRGAGIDVLEAVLLLLFVALFAWIAQAFISSLAGFAALIARRPARLGLDPAKPLPHVGVRTALLMPTYNEDPQRLLAGLRAMYESLGQTGQLDRFDFFVLSDTTKPDIALAEREAFAELLQKLGDHRHLFYRRRTDNAERKAGNIADWVRTFGDAYPQFVILDADSLMTGDTLVRLAAAMEKHPDVALVQTFPVVVNGSTLFARMQQFSGRVYGPVVAYGIAWWHGAESNYWGHNAIIRTRAFAENAGLPHVDAIKPFGGNILSHDFVEAALIRRGGWALLMVPGLPGSYEEGPPSLTDMLVRDRRWCQGNLQHGAVLPARGLHWVNRWHLLIGIGQYFTAPMWAMLMLVGMAIPLLHMDPETGYQPMAYWRDMDPERFVQVFLLTMGILFAPKILAFLGMLLNPALRRGCGGVVRAFISMLLESVLAALMAPITMYVQSRGVAEVLAGKDSGWDAQRRDDGSMSLGALVRSYGGMTVFGLLIGAVAWWISPGLVVWMSPVLAGLVLSIPIVALTSSRRLGLALRRVGIFQIPEEAHPPEVLQRADQLRRQLHG